MHEIMSQASAKREARDRALAGVTPIENIDLD